MALQLQTVAANTTGKEHRITLEGWEVRIARSLVDSNDRRLYPALRLLSHRLQQAKKLIPDKQIRQLLDTPIWLSDSNKGHGEFYFSERRLYRFGKNPEKLDAIEFHNISLFLLEDRHSPMQVIHELAHAFHKKNYNKIDKLIMRAWRHARQERLYRRVEHKTGKKHDAYAIKNAFEYFAELSETYFGENDYFPHNRKQLKKYDPKGYEMVKNIWNGRY